MSELNWNSSSAQQTAHQILIENTPGGQDYAVVYMPKENSKIAIYLANHMEFTKYLKDGEGIAQDVIERVDCFHEIHPDSSPKDDNYFDDFMQILRRTLDLLHFPFTTKNYTDCAAALFPNVNKEEYLSLLVLSQNSNSIG